MEEKGLACQGQGETPSWRVLFGAHTGMDRACTIQPTQPVELGHQLKDIKLSLGMAPAALAKDQN